MRQKSWTTSTPYACITNVSWSRGAEGAELARGTARRRHNQNIAGVNAKCQSMPFRPRRRRDSEPHGSSAHQPDLHQIAGPDKPPPHVLRSRQLLIKSTSCAFLFSLFDVHLTYTHIQKELANKSNLGILLKRNR